MNSKYLTLMIAMSISGCASQSDNYTCVFPDAPESPAPEWICSKMPEGVEVGGVGFAPKLGDSINVMRDIAANEARASLAEQLYTRVSKRFSKAVNANLGNLPLEQRTKTNEIFDVALKNTTRLSLQDSRIIQTLVSPSGGIHTLVGIDKLTYQRNMNYALSEAERELPNLWEKYNSQEFDQELDALIEELRSEQE